VIGLYVLRMVLLGGVFVVLLVSIVRTQNDLNRTHGAADLAIDAVAVDRSTTQLQASVRGYLLSHQGSLLVPFQRARVALPSELSALRGSVDSASERAAVNQVQRGIDVYISGVASPLVVAARHLSHRQTMALLNRGDGIMSGVGVQLSRLESSALAVRRERRSSLSSVVTLAGILTAIGLFLSVTMDFWITTFLLRGVLRPIRAVARAAAAMSRGDLDARVPKKGRGEVAMLATSFNEMAESTQARTSELDSTQERLGQALAVAEEASAMKSNFVANMSHEVRTPLNGLVGMLSLLSETSLDEEQRKYVEVAMSSSDALMHVVGDVLDIAKIEAGRMELEHLDFDLHEAVESVCDLMAATARAKRLELQSFVHEEVPRAVRGDPTRVCQILQNLVSNAVKFTPAGDVAVEVCLVSRSAERIVVRFEVKDSGIGIEPQRVGQLFEPFTQAELGTTRKFGGTGLGLAISRELAQLMHGTISGESSLGRGSTFSFDIPFQPAEAELPVPVPPADLQGVRVLVVDDNATNRRVFQSYVTGWGMRALATAGAHDAVAALRDAARAGDPFQIALLDLNLEGESGVDLAKQISETPELDETRMIMLTSSAGSRPDDLSFGITRRLAKPVRQARLLEAISTVLGAGARPYGRRASDLASPGTAAGRRLTDRLVPPGIVSGAVPLPSLTRRSPDSGSGSSDPVPDTPGSARILVAEDHDVNWMLIERLLSSRGHIVDRAADGEAVLAMLQDHRYDLILMDCQMPVRDGYDTTRELRHRGAHARRHDGPVPVVAMTASALDETRQRCSDAGMNGYLGKPITAEELDRVLDTWLPVGRLAGGGPAPPLPEEGAGGVPESTGDRAGAITLEPRQLDQLRRVYPGDKLNVVLRELAEEVTDDLDELTAALETGDQARIASAAHRIRNTGRVVGARELADAAAELDHPPQDDEPPVQFDPAVVQRLRALWEHVQEALAEVSRS
jgi:signal transduction histidine kinase/DNA-binding response OmpR family regulator